MNDSNIDNTKAFLSMIGLANSPETSDYDLWAKTSKNFSTILTDRKISLGSEDHLNFLKGILYPRSFFIAKELLDVS